MTTESGRVMMVVSLVDIDGTSPKAFATFCLEIDLKDFSLGGEWFIKPFWSLRNPYQSYYHYEVMQL